MAQGVTLQAPFPWFGGKSRAAALIWDRLGDVPNYVEPFAGSLAVLLGRPSEPGIETVNDKDGYLANFWRAVAHDPEAVAHWADWPVNEIDQHARHLWLLEQRDCLEARLIADPDYFDARVAGWWVWGICCWIGAGWCSGAGPWALDDEGQLVHLGDAGQGVHRKRVHLGDAGRGVHRQLVHLGDAGQGVGFSHSQHIAWFADLAERLRRVRVCCGDWTRVCGRTPTEKLGLTGVVLDPPYAVDAGRAADLYRVDEDVSAAVRAWALEHGANPQLRIALCGYDGEHDMPTGWELVEWKAKGGYASRGSRGEVNARRERVWFSPHCLKADRYRPLPLFGDKECR